MSGWLAKAANVFKPEIPDAPQPFLLRCGCGQQVQGMRHSHPQQILCKACGTSLFVLPRDVYPVPQPVTKSKTPQAAPVSIPVEELLEETESEEVVEISEDDFLEDDSAPALTNKKRHVKEENLPSLEQLRQRMKDAARPRSPQPEKVTPSDEPGLFVTWGAALKESLQESWKGFIGFWTPFRLVGAGVLLVMMITAGWTLRQSVLANAVKVAQRESELGMAAIENEEWTIAREHLVPAAAALDRLGRTDPDAQTIRQYARETQAQFRLSEVTLEEILLDAQSEYASRDNNKKKKDASTKNLAVKHRGDWLIIEGTVEDMTPGKSRERNYAIRIPAHLAGETGSVTIRVDFPVLDELVPAAGKQNVILAGAIEDCERDNENNGWTVRLDPETGFLWTHLNTWKAIGFDTTNPLRTEANVQAELDQQAQAMGVPQ